MRYALFALCLALVACGGEPPPAQRCDPGWTCPDCQNYARLNGVCYRLDPAACGPSRLVCQRGEICTTLGYSAEDGAPVVELRCLARE